MECPNCGAPEAVRVKVCGVCGEAYASQDLLEWHQLRFLLAETEAWGVSETLRSPYRRRLEALRARLGRRAPADRAAAPAPTPAVGPGVAEAPQPVRAPAPPPTREKVPFDQWLLSERNIKLALYSGGLLLVLAGLIFVGVNWTRIPGPGKFAITLMISGLTYLGGYLLFQRPAYRLGGIALLGVASGFIPLNFAVLQIYVLGPGGLRDDVMWLIASPLCLLLYASTAYWTRGDLFTYLSLAAVGSTATAALVVLEAPILAFVLAYALLALAIMLLARALRSTPWEAFTRTPLLAVSQGLTPLVVVASLIGWVSETGCDRCGAGGPWLALLSLGVAVVSYAVANAVFEWLAARWAAAVLVPLAFSLLLVELAFSETAIAIALMALALAHLGVGYALERREGRRSGGWPLYATGYAVAFFVTIQAISETEDLIKVLLGDVALLAASAAIHRDYRWVYGAAWLFLLPASLFFGLHTSTFHAQGLLLGVVGLNYVAVGYGLARRRLQLGGPFLTAAAFLSVVVVVLTWEEPLIAAVVLGVIAVLYALGSLEIDEPWLLLPALLAVNLLVLAVNRALFEGTGGPSPRALTLSYAFLGACLAFGGLALRRVGEARWAWPLYLAGSLDLGGAYLAGLLEGEGLAIGLSGAFAGLLLAFAWLERAAFLEREIPPVLAYLGLIAVFIGLFYVVHSAGPEAWGVWPAYSALLCATFVALSWPLRRGRAAEVYADPLRHAGSWLMAVPMAGVLPAFDSSLGAATFAIAGVTYAADAFVGRALGLAYLSLGAFVVALWASLMTVGVSELQAYVIPLGLALLGVGWLERLRQGGATYQLATMSGLIVLMGSAFIQSLPRGASSYAWLLAFESLAALGWGVWTRSRGYVQLGGLALIANALAQFGPAFVEMPRWVQLGVTGSLLLGGGLAALFKREEILAARRRLVQEWRQWEP